MIRADKLEAFLLCACAAILALQLFISPSIGLADNGDFSRVYARFSLAPVRGADDNFAYFAPRYWFTPESSWTNDLLSSEMVLAAPPILIAHAVGSGTFDIRWLGAVHALLFLAAYYALLVYLRAWKGWRRLVVGVAALWMFGDVAYVAYCNSFYSDTAALLGALLMVCLALHAAGSKGSREGVLLLFTAAALLFISSKPQHAAVGLIAVVITLWVLRRGVLSALLICAVWASIARAPAVYRAKPLFNLVFDKIAAQSATPLQDLRELGLDAADLRFIGMTTATPGGPASDPRWMADFARRSGFGKVIWFHLRHPARTLRILAGDLRLEAYQIRPQDLGNFRREAGLPPGTRTQRFASWSRLRTALFIRWPWHILVWYALFLGAGIKLMRGSRAAAIAVGVAAMGIGEFALSSLSDSLEAAHHLLLFHALTDVTFCFALAWLLSSGLSRAIRRGTGGADSGPLPANS
jgi:hypothetical protein